MTEPGGGAEPADGAGALLSRAAERIAAAREILITCHRGPDGDSVGSMVALASLCRTRGARAVLYNPDPVPRRLKWLPLSRSFVRKLKPTDRFALTVVVDCGDPKLLGAFPPPAVTGPVIALDHHATGRPFGDLFVCDPGASSVGVLVARIADRLGWPITPEAALGIYVSLLSDTGGFRHANTTAEALRLAAALVEGGVEPWSVAERMSDRATLAGYRLLAAALGTLELRLGGKVAFMTITREMVKTAGATWEDSEGLINFARALDGVECGVLITPSKYGGVRVSMRSRAKLIDAAAVCETLGGGGHPGAAGCTLPVPIVPGADAVPDRASQSAKVDAAALAAAASQIETVLEAALAAALSGAMGKEECPEQLGGRAARGAVGPRDPGGDSR